jgi:hypothetical protein
VDALAALVMGDKHWRVVAQSRVHHGLNAAGHQVVRMEHVEDVLARATLRCQAQTLAALSNRLRQIFSAPPQMENTRRNERTPESEKERRRKQRK